MRKLYDIFKVSKIQKTIRGNTVITFGKNIRPINSVKSRTTI